VSGSQNLVSKDSVVIAAKEMMCNQLHVPTLGNSLEQIADVSSCTHRLALLGLMQSAGSRGVRWAEPPESER
jgi:hypothetical protein